MFSKVQFPNLSRRSAQPEIMDDAKSDCEALYRTLGQFAIINRFISRTPGLFKRMLFRDIQKRGLSRVTILDIGAGGGDFARWCVWFLRRRMSVRVICVDNDKRVIDYLRRTCAGFPEIEIIHASALRLDEPSLCADYVIANHLLHHLTDDQIPEVIGKAFSAARYGLLFNDLSRHPIWYVFFSIVAGIFFRGGFVLKDGLMSIRKGFTRGEFTGYSEQCGLSGRIRVGRWMFGHVYICAVK